MREIWEFHHSDLISRILRSPDNWTSVSDLAVDQSAIQEKINAREVAKKAIYLIVKQKIYTPKAK